MLAALRFLFGLSGRVSVPGYWLFYVVPCLVLAHLPYIVLYAGYFPGWLGLWSAGLMLVYFWPSIAVPVKRLHDWGRSGWWICFLLGLYVMPVLFVVHRLARIAEVQLAFEQLFAGEGTFPGLLVAVMLEAPVETLLMAVIPSLAGLIAFALFGLVPGQRGANRFGPDPLANWGEGLPKPDFSSETRAAFKGTKND